ncbi:hypothetical protein [uncultured Alistipes sp.]|jgi:hypothetical protein|uniref:Uncharacterized protein n=1 Tax=Alistipes shahii WAL 8301 TaxID=717959 RepID=D4IIP4_9BACT|nr:hypothetical protein [uncultured Alistipes sp.]CBK62806.1 hypothetical protein AL1_00810 [Alistipes shahii WAL 8301]
MVGAGRRRKRPRTGQKYNFLPNAGFLFNLSYLFDAAKTYHASQTETKRRPGFRFGFQSENLLFTVQGTKNRRHTEQNGQKKESPATESPEIRAEIRRREARHRMRPGP